MSGSAPAGTWPSTSSVAASRNTTLPGSVLVAASAAIATRPSWTATPFTPPPKGAKSITVTRVGLAGSARSTTSTELAPALIAKTRFEARSNARISMPVVFGVPAALPV
jgi:hypothetical protein